MMRATLETIEEGQEDEQQTMGGGDFSVLQNKIPKRGNSMVIAVGLTMDEGQEEDQVRKTCGCS